METSNKLSRQCEDTLASMLGLALHFLEVLRFNDKNPQQLYAVCLYARLLELASGCKALLEKNALAGISILLRSMFEADIDLTNMLKCPEYWKRMEASFFKEKLRLTKEAASSTPNPYLGEIRAKRKPSQDLKEIQADLDRLIAEKNGPIDIRCRADFAGRQNEYLTIYTTLCLDTHNNIQSLRDWHLEVTSPNDYQVIVFKKDKTDLLGYLSAIAGIILQQTKALADFLKTEGIEFNKYFQEMETLQEMLNQNAEKE